MDCASCGAANPETGKFCSQCGSLLAAVPEPARPVGERRQATVMFADMEGYTPLAERLGEEGVFALMKDVIARLIEVVEAHDGAVQEVMGDGIMALFGAPVAVEDAPLKACRAALEIHRRMAEEADAVEAAHGVRPRLRAGLHAGPMVVGEVGTATRATVTALGDTVNMAARLEGAAEPGTTLMSKALHALVEGYVEATDLGPMALKGKSEPQTVYRLDGVAEGMSRFEASVRRGLTPLVGRADELARLDDAWQAARADGAQMVELVGEPGIGTSRLMYEFRTRLEADNVFVLQGQCAADGRSRPFLPFIEVVRSSFRLREQAPREEVVQKLGRGIDFLGLDADELTPYLLNLLGIEVEDATIRGLDTEVLGYRTRDAILKLLGARCRVTPTALFLDDLQWIDSGSEALVARALDGDAFGGLLVVCGYRGGYTPPWNAASNVSRIEMRALAGAGFVDLVKARLDVGEVPDRLIEMVADKTGGNPLFVEEVISYLEGKGQLESDGSGVALAPGADAEGLPVSLENLLMDQVDHLQEQDRSILQVAAVAGRGFAPELVARASGLDAVATQSLERLAELGLIVAEAGGDHAFKNALLQEAVYSGLLSARRAELHAQLAAEIERTHANQLQELAHVLAHHWSRTDQADKAVRALAAAGRQSLRVYALDEAENRFRAAIERAEANPDCVDDIFIADLLLDVARVHYFQCDFKSVIALAEAHLPRIEALGDRRRLARFLFEGGYANVFGGNHRVGRPMLERAIEIGKADGIEEAEAYGTLGLVWNEAAWGHYDDGIDERVVGYGERVVEIGERIGDVWLTSKALLAMRQFYATKYGGSRAEAYGKRLLDLSRRTGDPRPRGMAMWARAYDHAFRGDLEATIEDADEALRICLSPVDRVQATAARGIAYAMVGRADEAITHLKEARDIFDRGGLELARVFGEAPYGLALVMSGRIAEGVGQLEAMAERFTAMGQEYARPYADFFLGEIYRNVAASTERPPWPVIRQNLGFLLRTVPFAKRLARRHLEAALADFRRMDFQGFIVLALLSLGELHRAEKRVHQARDCFEEGREIAQAMQDHDPVAKFDAALAALG